MFRPSPLTLIRVALPFALALSTCFAHAGDTDDTVHLQNGGRVRGVVIEEDPAKGVTLKLPDGTTRNIPASDVKSVEYKGEKPTKAPSAAPPEVEAAAEGAHLSRPDVSHWGLSASAGLRNGHYGGGYPEVSLAHLLPLTAKLALRSDLYAGSGRFDYTSHPALGAGAPSEIKSEGTMTLVGVRVALQRAFGESVFARAGLTLARTSTSGSGSCDSYSKSGLAYGGSLAGGLRFGKQGRAELGPRVDYGFWGVEKCAAKYQGTTMSVAKYTKGPDRVDEASLILTVQLTYFFW